MYEYTVIGVHGFASTLLANSPQEAIDTVLVAYGEMCGLTPDNVLVVNSGVYEDSVVAGECTSDLYARVKNGGLV